MNLLRFREVLSYYCRTAYEVSCLLCYALSICYATARPSSYHGHLAIGTIATSIVTSAVTELLVFVLHMDGHSACP